MALNVLLIEPYYGGSHKTWADGYQRHSQHNVTLLTLPAQFWKWRMQGGAVTLARMFRDGDYRADVILASDMFDLSTFRALTRAQTTSLPMALYFHENQLTYPQNSRQRHGWQYGFINYTSALAADTVIFNSAYHRGVFYKSLPNMLKHFPEYNELQTVDELQVRSLVLPPGVNLRRYDEFEATSDGQRLPPLLVWNHRWEEDKNPKAFFRALYGLLNRDIEFRVALVGENFQQDPTAFIEARERLGDRVVQYGYVEHFADYARLLWEADYVVSTARQEFFGIAAVEAIYCGCVPLLPARLNYRALLPEAWHDACLFSGDDLLPLLHRHLNGEVTVDVGAFQTHVAAFDWSVVAPQYDAVISRLAQRQFP